MDGASGAGVEPLSVQTYSMPFGADGAKTATYREYDSHGKGVNGGHRVVVSPPLTDAERSRLTPQALLAGNDQWDPITDVERLRSQVH